MLGLSRGSSLLWAGNAYGFVLVLISAVLIYVLARMGRRVGGNDAYGGYGAAIEGYELRFARRAEALEAKLPRTSSTIRPCSSSLPVAHENDADETEAIRRLYEQLRQRFSDWRDEFARLHALNESGAVGLPEKFAERYDELDGQLSRLLADVKRLDARAAEIRRELEDRSITSRKVRSCSRAPKPSCARRFGSKVPEELSAMLKLARQRLAEARAAIAAGAERPLDAVGWPKRSARWHAQ